VTSRFDRVPLPRVILAIALLIAIVLSCRGILSDDPQAMFDMPRYLMNGVFLREGEEPVLRPDPTGEDSLSCRGALGP